MQQRTNNLIRPPPRHESIPHQFANNLRFHWLHFHKNPTMRNLIKNQRPAPLWLFGLVAAAWLVVYLPANFWFGPSRISAPWREAMYPGCPRS